MGWNVMLRGVKSPVFVDADEYHRGDAIVFTRAGKEVASFLERDVLGIVEHDPDEIPGIA